MPAAVAMVVTPEHFPQVLGKRQRQPCINLGLNTTCSMTPYLGLSPLLLQVGLYWTAGKKQIFNEQPKSTDETLHVPLGLQ